MDFELDLLDQTLPPRLQAIAAAIRAEDQTNQGDIEMDKDQIQTIAKNAAKDALGESQSEKAVANIVERTLVDKAEIEREMQAVKAQAETVKAEAEVLKAEIETLKADKAALETQAVTLNKDLDTAKASLAEAEGKLDEANATLRKQRTEASIADRKAQLAEAGITDEGIVAKTIATVDNGELAIDDDNFALVIDTARASKPAESNDKNDSGDTESKSDASNKAEASSDTLEDGEIADPDLSAADAISQATASLTSKHGDAKPNAFLSIGVGG